MRHAISQTLPLADRVYTVEPLDNPRAMPSDELAALAGEYCADGALLGQGAGRGLCRRL